MRGDSIVGFLQTLNQSTANVDNFKYGRTGVIDEEGIGGYLYLSGIQEEVPMSTDDDPNDRLAHLGSIIKALRSMDIDGTGGSKRMCPVCGTCLEKEFLICPECGKEV